MIYKLTTCTAKIILINWCVAYYAVYILDMNNPDTEMNLSELLYLCKRTEEFTVQKIVVRLMAGRDPINSCRGLF